MSTADLVSLRLTGRQARVLEYVLTRAQEDPAFFDALGGSDITVSRALRATLTQLVQLLGAAPDDRLGEIPLSWLRDEVDRVLRANPHDGRTIEGRAWADAARRVLRGVSG